MKTIAIIGVGSIGRRHAEGVSKIKDEKCILLVDPIKKNLSNALKLIDQKKTRVKCFRNVELIPNSIDLAILSCNSDQRYQVFEKLVYQRKIKNILLEKIIFTDTKSLFNFKELVSQKKIKTWVNFTRREVAFYRNLKKKLRGEQIKSFEVIGGEWGLASNSLHFLDLILFLRNENEIVGNLESYQLELTNSKRSGFFEFFGELSFNLNNTYVCFNSFAGGDFSHLIKIRTDKSLIFIDETNDKAWIKNDDTSIFSAINLPLMSEVSEIITANIINNGTCFLPEYNYSMKLHEFYINQLEFLNLKFKTNNFTCIT